LQRFRSKRGGGEEGDIPSLDKDDYSQNAEYDAEYDAECDAEYDAESRNVFASQRGESCECYRSRDGKKYFTFISRPVHRCATSLRSLRANSWRK